MNLAFPLDHLRDARGKSIWVLKGDRHLYKKVPPYPLKTLRWFDPRPPNPTMAKLILSLNPRTGEMKCWQCMLLVCEL